MKKTLLLLWMSLCSAAWSVQLDSAANLQFELEPPGSVKVPAKWDYPLVDRIKLEVTEDVPAGVNFTRSLSVDYSGAQSGDEGRMFLSDWIELAPQMRYIQTFFLKTSGKTEKGFGITAGRMFYDENKKIIAYDGYNTKRFFISNVGPAEWTEFQQELIPYPGTGEIKDNMIPPGAKYARIVLLSYGYNKKYFHGGHSFEPVQEYSSASPYGDQFQLQVAQAPEKSIVIDGKIDDALWQNQTGWQNGFRRVVCSEEESRKVQNQTAFKVASDGKNLYFAFRCITEPGKLKSQPRERNDKMLHGDDVVEVFLDGNGRREQILHLALNADGAWSETLNGIAANLNIEAKSIRSSDGWTGEMRIPMDKLWQLFNEAGSDLNKDMWNLLVCRHQPELPLPEQYSAWIYTGKGGFLNKDALGLLLFRNQREVLQNKLQESIAQMETLLSENKALMAPSDLPEISNAQRQLLEMKAFADDMKTSLDKTPSVSSEAFAKYITPCITLPERMRQGIANLKRLSFFFPADREKYGYLLFSVPLVEKVSKNRLPEEEDLIKVVKMAALRDEITSARLGIFSRNDLKDVKITWSSLRSDLATIPTDRIDVRIIEPWGNNNQADLLLTDLRIPLDGFLKDYDRQERFIPEIAARTTRQLLVQVDITPETAAGIYRGTLEIRPGNAPATTLPVELEVSPVLLERTQKDVGFYSHQVLFQPKGPGIGTRGAMFYNGMENETSFLESVRMLTRNGFNYVNYCDYAAGPLGEEYTANLLRLAYEGGLRKVGLMGSEHFFDEKIFEEANREKLAENLASMKTRYQSALENASKLGFEVCNIYGFDEPHTPHGVAVCNAIFQAAKEAGGTTATACIFENIREDLDNLDTIIMSYMSMTGEKNKLLDAVASGRPTGYRRALYYANLTNDFAKESRLTYGWYLAKSKMDGNVAWALYYLHYYWEPFRDISKDFPFATAYYVIPTQDRPIQTMKFIAAKTGVDDLRYIETLEKMIAETPDKTLAQEAQQALNEMLGKFEVYNAKGIYSNNFAVSARTYDQLQSQLRQWIAKLNKSMKKGSL